MKILGIHDGHNAAISLLEDGKITFALQEERPTNKKNFFGFPEKALAYLFQYKHLNPSDIDYVALSSSYIGLPMTSQDVKTHFGWQGTPLAVVIKKISKLAPIQKMRVNRSLQRRIGALEKAGFSREKIMVLDHHLCHAAAAYYGLAESQEKKYLVLTLDGGGDWLCGSVNIAQGGKIETIATTPYGNSIGDLFARTTYMMGFTPWEHEYKLMGLAPYTSDRYSREVADLYWKYLDLDAKDPLVFKKKIFEDTNHILPRLERDLKRVRFDNIAGGIQLFTEEILVKWVRACIQKTNIHDVLLGGGVFMNIKANKVISEIPEVESIQTFPSCGDESNAMGAAWLLYRDVTGTNGKPLEDYYLGPSFTDQEAEEIIRKDSQQKGFKWEKCTDINQNVAELLAEGKIVARVNGPMEFGARALGNRSILADPQDQKVVHVINNSIKSRDFWMPFAPIMLEKNAERYLVNPKNLLSPYMMMGFDTTESRDELSAAVHPSDKSARAQILREGQNEAMEDILSKFQNMTGRAALLNTSFNLHGYPVVFGPKEALWTFHNSGLQYLAINNFLITK